MIPTFPNFKRLELTDRPDVERFTRPYPPYSDYNFTSLWCWDVHERIAISQLHDHLVVRFTDYESGAPFYSFLGVSDRRSCEVAERLLTQAANEGIEPVLHLLPEHVVRELNGGKFCLEEDKDNHDYILDLNAMASLQGTRFGSQRCRLHQFHRNYPNARVVGLDLRDHCIRAAIDRVLTTWKHNKGHAVPNEEKAIERLLGLDGAARLAAISIYIQRDLVAFAVDEQLEDGYAMSHFAKADVRVKGVYAYLHHAMAQSLQAMGCRLVNWEQDLGIPGLRDSKRQWRPVRFLKKYRLSPDGVAQGDRHIFRLTGVSEHHRETGEK